MYMYGNIKKIIIASTALYSYIRHQDFPSRRNRPARGVFKPVLADFFFSFFHKKYIDSHNLYYISAAKTRKENIYYPRVYYNRYIRRKIIMINNHRTQRTNNNILLTT